MNSRENREGGTGGKGGGRRWPASDGGWVKRGDGARMETAETEGGESARGGGPRERRTGRVERTRCPRGRMKGRLPATTY